MIGNVAGVINRSVGARRRKGGHDDGVELVGDGVESFFLVRVFTIHNRVNCVTMSRIMVSNRFLLIIMSVVGM